jgi:hypothetical protein
MASIPGTNGADVLFGTQFDDIITGGGNDDVLFGNDGDDGLFGGNGDDTLFGQHGDDVHFAGNGSDTSYGGDGDDVLFGEGGTDVLYGEFGDDVLTGGNNPDVLYGGAGEDLMIGENGSDAMYGGDADDEVFAGNGSDVLYGDAGEDLMLGDNGDDEMFGGAGGDILIGGDHTDLLRGDEGDDHLFGGNQADMLEGNLGDDRLHGDNGTDTLYGSAGGDRLDGGQGSDTATGGDGADTFVMSTGDDVVLDFSPAVPVLIDFEGIAPQNNDAQIPDGYAGLDWSDGFWAYDDGAAPAGSGYANVIASGEAGGYNFEANDVSFTSDTDFDLLSVFLAAAWNTELNVTIEAWDDGLQVGEATLTFDFLQIAVDFQAGTAPFADVAFFSGTFDSIDEVRIASSGGVDAVPGGEGSHVAMDDLLIAFNDGDLIEVPLGTDLDDLVAGAVDDGSGNTVLSLPGRTMTLEGVDVADVSTDWFVFG